MGHSCIATICELRERGYFIPGSSVGIVGLQDYGFPERSIAIDLLVKHSSLSGWSIKFVLDAAFLDMKFIKRAIVTEKFLDIVMVSVRAASSMALRLFASALAERAATNLEMPRVIFGGAVATSAPELLFELYPQCVVWGGEIEEFFNIVLDDSILLKKIATPTILTALLSSRRGGSIWVESSRGCGARCSFCCLQSAIVDSRWRSRPIKDLIAEIEQIAKHTNNKMISFSDYSAFESRKYTEKFIKEFSVRSIDFHFRCDMRLHVIKRLSDLIPGLYRAGLRQVYVGIESLVKSRQRDYEKKIEDFSVLRWLEDIGVSVVVGLIVLDPLYTRMEFRQQVLKLKKSGLLDLIATPLKTLRLQRGTPFVTECLNAGVKLWDGGDLCELYYECKDMRLELIRRILSFFHRTTKVIYGNVYIENMCKMRGNVDRYWMKKLNRISTRMRNAEYSFLDDISVKASSMDKNEDFKYFLIERSIKFENTRRNCFERTAHDYSRLISDGFPWYKEELINFADNVDNLPSFTPEIMGLPYV